jgi:putative effector of murein hydrolase/putative effector of murein hydrolase LrgA (UPF0299 family)
VVPLRPTKAGVLPRQQRQSQQHSPPQQQQQQQQQPPSATPTALRASSGTWSEEDLQLAKAAAAKAVSAPTAVDEKEASVLKVGLSFLLLVVADHALLIGMKGVPFPSSLAGMIALWTSLLAVDKVSPRASAAVMRWIAPGAALLAGWLPLFFAPSLIKLPMSAFRPAGSELAKLVVIVVGGFLASLAGTALFANSLASGGGGGGGRDKKEKALGKVSYPLGSGPALGRSDRGEAAAKAAAANVPLPSAPWTLPASAALTAGGLASLLLAKAKAAKVGAAKLSEAARAAQDAALLGAAAPLLTGATFLGFTGGVRLKSPLLHPVLLCAATTVAAASAAASILAPVLGGVAGGGGSLLPAVLGASYFGSRSATGSLLLMLLGPSVLSFAVPMFSRRRLMKQEFAACTLAPLAGAFGGLFGTALLARALALPAATAIATLPRQLTSPLAMACAGMLGADTSAAVTLVVITGLIGANAGAKILDALNVKDPTARGLAMGTAAHGLGTAALASTETAAFPFAAVSMALTGTFSTIIVAIPALKRALLALATGS